MGKRVYKSIRINGFPLVSLGGYEVNVQNYFHILTVDKFNIILI